MRPEWVRRQPTYSGWLLGCQCPGPEVLRMGKQDDPTITLLQALVASISQTSIEDSPFSWEE